MSEGPDKSDGKIAVLVSGRGSNLQAILDACEDGRIAGKVVLVLSNRPRAKGLDRAREHGVDAVAVDHKKFDGREPFEKAMVQEIEKRDADLVVLAGFMRLLTPYFVNRFRGRLMNIHPALLPAFPGINVQAQAVDYGVRYSGCTVHFVDDGVDTGPIILQSVVPIEQDDDEDTLSARILEREHQIYPEAIKLFFEGRLSIDGRRVRIKGGLPSLSSS